jgi:outer membrane biosynthesis protein TonB
MKTTENEGGRTMQIVKRQAVELLRVMGFRSTDPKWTLERLTNKLNLSTIKDDQSCRDVVIYDAALSTVHANYFRALDAGEKIKVLDKIEDAVSDAAEPATVIEEPKKSKMMQQYRDAKAKHPGMVLLFRMGDFYEAFEEDAELVSRVLGLTLTTRDKTIPMCGFPVTSLEIHLRKLLQGGHRVAVCDDLESPEVRRYGQQEVTEPEPESVVEEPETERLQKIADQARKEADEAIESAKTIEDEPESVAEEPKPEPTQEPEKPKKKREKVDAGKGPSMISVVIETLKKATSQNPTTKEHLVNVLLEQFPNQSNEKTLKSSVNWYLTAKKGILSKGEVVSKNDNGFWI